MRNYPGKLERRGKYPATSLLHLHAFASHVVNVLVASVNKRLVRSVVLALSVSGLVHVQRRVARRLLLRQGCQCLVQLSCRSAVRQEDNGFASVPGSQAPHRLRTALRLHLLCLRLFPRDGPRQQVVVRRVRHVHQRRRHHLQLLGRIHPRARALLRQRVQVRRRNRDAVPAVRRAAPRGVGAGHGPGAEPRVGERLDDAVLDMDLVEAECAAHLLRSLHRAHERRREHLRRRRQPARLEVRSQALTELARLRAAACREARVPRARLAFVGGEEGLGVDVVEPLAVTRHNDCHAACLRAFPAMKYRYCS
eukprot:Rhum_TRINITY_DN6242_c0_g1::Rhum_TRINITY_DN6242_c0_g1_i1::g.19397::m.19397